MRQPSSPVCGTKETAAGHTEARRAGSACQKNVTKLGDKRVFRAGASVGGTEDLRSGWTVVAPFYNEERYIGAMLASLLAQTRPPRRVIFVDNASTDASHAVIAAFQSANPALETLTLTEPRPGKVSALRTGIAAIDTEYAALCDADTYYPPAYLARAEALLAAGAAAALAFGMKEGGLPALNALRAAKGRAASLLMPRQAHTGGFGQAFRTADLRAAGGYCPDRWPFMVADHEIIHRVEKHGPIAYSARHVCTPSSRRRDRRRVDWSLYERLRYHVTPLSRRDWFFYTFLAERFRRRGLVNANLRQRDWERKAA